jgi:hypothetical protein
VKPRIRTVKPELHKHETLFDLEKETGLPMRIAWVGMFAIADREGRFLWRPRTLKAEILPYDEGVDFLKLLEAWERAKMVYRYEVAGEWYGWIPTFKDHQVINNRESPSELPPHPQEAEILASFTRRPRVLGKDEAEGNGTEGNGSEGAGGAGGAPSAAGDLPQGQFAIAPELRGNSVLEQALSHVPPTVQADWLVQFTPRSIKKTLLKAINALLADAKTDQVTSIPNLGARITSWIAREKESLVKLPAPATPKDPPKAWGSGPTTVLGMSATEALRRAQAAK